MTIAAPFMLRGQSLVDFVNDKTPLITRGELTRTDMIKDAGYVYDNGKAMYVNFYTELLNAKGVTPTTTQDLEDVEYDNLSTDDKDLYDAITELLGEKWTHEETIEFMEELGDIDITDADVFKESFEYESDDRYDSAYAEFAEYFTLEILNASIPDIALPYVNWDKVWQYELAYNYDVIHTDNGTFFFSHD